MRNNHKDTEGHRERFAFQSANLSTEGMTGIWMMGFGEEG